jgi:hypothetical protein
MLARPVRTAARGPSLDLLRLITIWAPLGIIAALMWMGARTSHNRLRGRNAELRSEIEARVRFATTLDRARIHRSGGRGWLPVRGPVRLVVGTDAFIFSAPKAFGECAFRGSQCSIKLSRAPVRFGSRDWIVITGQDAGRRVQLGISPGNLLDVWQALAATGAAT